MSYRNIFVKMKNPEVTLSAHEVGWDIFGPKAKRTPAQHCARINTWIQLGALIPCNENGSPLDAAAPAEAPAPNGGEGGGMESTGAAGTGGTDNAPPAKTPVDELLDVNANPMNRAGCVEIVDRINAADPEAGLVHDGLTVPKLKETITGWQEATVSARGGE